MLDRELFAACGDGDLAKLTELLSNSSRGDNLPFTEMLEKAASKGHSDIIQYLLSFNPSYTIIDDQVIRAAIYSGSSKSFKALSTKEPAVLNVEQERRGTPLAIALASRASPEFLLFLLAEGADPNIYGDDTLSPLSLAAGLYPTPDIVKILLEHGAELNGSSALAAASSMGKVDTVKYLLEKGADPNDGGTRPLPFYALHGAVEKGNHEIFKLLLEHGADPDVRNGKGQTVLIKAQEIGNAEAIRLLEGDSN